jgi:hypothetical protein
MISLAPHSTGGRAEHVVSTVQAVENVSEVEARRPPELIPRTTIDIDAIDAREHFPMPTTVHVLVGGEQLPNNAWRIRLEA